jgi:hypothetical protein
LKRHKGPETSDPKRDDPPLILDSSLSLAPSSSGESKDVDEVAQVPFRMK